MGRLLIIDFHLPAGVVSHCKDDLRIVPHRRVELHRIEAERAVAGRDEHVALRRQQARRNAIGHADADAAERAGVEDGLDAAEANAGKREEIAAVDDQHRVGREVLLQGGEHAVGMHLAVLAGRRGGERGLEFGGALDMLRPVAADPFCIDAGFAVAGEIGHRLQRFRWRRQNFDCAAPVVAQLGAGVADADELRLAEHAGRAEGHLEIQLAANGQHHVRVAHDGAARRGDDAWVIVRHNAAALAGVEIGGAEAVEEADEFGPRLLRAAPADDQRPLCRPQEIDRRLHLIGRRHQHDARLGTEMLLHLDRLRHFGA